MGEKVDTAVTMRLLYWLPRDGNSHRAELITFSPGGVAFYAPSAIEPGTRIKVALCTQQQEDKHVTHAIPAQVSGCSGEGERFRVMANLIQSTEEPVAPSAAKADDQDRRRHPRHDVRLKGFYSMVAGGETIDCEVRDISREGVMFTATTPARAGTKIHLTVHAGKGGPLKKEMRARVEVLRSVHIGNGVYEVGAVFASKPELEA